MSSGVAMMVNSSSCVSLESLVGLIYTIMSEKKDTYGQLPDIYALRNDVRNGLYIYVVN